MLNPNSLKAKPADNYDDLKKQFFALKNLCESKIKQCSIYSNKLAEYDRESILARSEALESEKEMNAQLTEELAKANERVIDSIIEPLYKTRWSGDLSDAPVSEMRDQLFKTLRDQTMGYWSGHTAYNIAVDGGFLINDKKGANKRLTSLGAMFVEQEQLRKEQE
jgi:hypothetical protein